MQSTLTRAPRQPLVPPPLEPFEERVCSLRHAISLVRGHDQVAFASKVNEHNCVIVDVSRACALRALRSLKGRVKTVAISDCFGTLVVG